MIFTVILTSWPAPVRIRRGRSEPSRIRPRQGTPGRRFGQVHSSGRRISSSSSSMWSLASASPTPSSMMWGRWMPSPSAPTGARRRRRRRPPGRCLRSSAAAASASASASSSSGSLARLLTVSPSSTLDQPDALGVAADGADRVDLVRMTMPPAGRQHDLVGVGDLGHGDDRPVAVGGLDVDQALAAAVLGAVLGQQASACRSPGRRRSGCWPGPRRRWPRPCR